MLATDSNEPGVAGGVETVCASVAVTSIQIGHDVTGVSKNSIMFPTTLVTSFHTPPSAATDIVMGSDESHNEGFRELASNKKENEKCDAAGGASVFSNIR
jgi:hypothetical protein